MTSPITKTVRLTGQAGTVEDAISTVLGRAAHTIERIRSFRVVEIGGEVAPSGVAAAYRVTVDITFEVKPGTEAR